MNPLERYKVQPGTKVKLKDVDPDFTDDRQNDKDVAAELERCQKRLRELQELLYAERKRSLLICLQALDTGGKDGTINHVLSAMNPQGCRVVSFKTPSAEELSHDFLWRVHRSAPANGEVVVFNRSHYEDVLAVRVHNLVPEANWTRRYDRINAFEKNLADHGTQILKFYLHISKEEQLKRFKQRLDDPTKHWKISQADYTERGFWDDYISAYEVALSECSKERAPWFIIPANHKWFRNLVVAQIVVASLEAMDLKYPEPTVDIKKIREEYHATKKA